MYPTRPILLTHPNEKVTVFAEHQPEYNALPVIANGDHVTSRWQLNWKERFHMFFHGYFFITQKNFREPLQPILPSIEQPEPWR